MRATVPARPMQYKREVGKQGPALGTIDPRWWSRYFFTADAGAFLASPPLSPPAELLPT